MSRTRTLTVRVGLAALLVGGIGMVIGPGASAQSASTFTLRARADSVGVQLIAKDAPGVSIGGGEIAFVTPASAQAELDSLGGSRAFASAPYPGDLIVSLPATVSGLLGGVEFPVPGYPFYVSTEHPIRGEQSEDVGSYAMSARSGANASEGSARIGVSTAPPQVASVTSTARVERDPETGRAVATATTEVAPFSVSRLFRLGDIRTTARAEYDPSDPDAPPTLESSMSVGTITVAGLEFGLTDEGLVAAGEPLLPVDLSAVTDLLLEAGVEIEYVPEQRTDTSVTSAGLRITYQEEFPDLGETTVRLVLGQTSVTADRGIAIGGPVNPPEVLVIDPVVPPPATAVGDLPEVSSPTPVAPVSPPTEIGSAPFAAPSVAPPAAPDPGSSLVAAPGPALPLPGADLWSLYPILAAGGMLAIVTSRLTSWHALRRRLSASLV